MKKDKKMIEEVLLSGTSLEDLIKMKMSKEVEDIFSNDEPKTFTTKLITDIKQVPRDKIFSKDSVFRIYNIKNKTKSFINGIQVESLLSLEESIREKVQQGLLDTFSVNDFYIKFENLKLITK